MFFGDFFFGVYFLGMLVVHVVGGWGGLFSSQILKFFTDTLLCLVHVSMQSNFKDFLMKNLQHKNQTKSCKSSDMTCVWICVKIVLNSLPCA